MRLERKIKRREQRKNGLSKIHQRLYARVVHDLSTSLLHSLFCQKKEEEEVRHLSLFQIWFLKIQLFQINKIIFYFVKSSIHQAYNIFLTLREPKIKQKTQIIRSNHASTICEKIKLKKKVNDKERVEHSVLNLAKTK